MENNKVGVGVSSNLIDAVKTAISTIEDTKSILVNIVAPKDATLKNVEDAIESIRDNRDIEFSLTITEELTDKYVVVIIDLTK